MDRLNPNLSTLIVDGYAKSQKAVEVTQGCNYEILYNSSKSCVFSVVDTTVKAKNNWIFRLDKPHKNVNFDHMNINHKFSGVPDPHLKLPPGTLTTSEYVLKIGSFIHKIAVSAIVMIDSCRVAYAVFKDYNDGGIKNTVETTSDIGGGWCGGFAGAKTGAAIGTSVFPGIGTMVGGMAGAVSGGIGGIWVMRKVVDNVASSDPNYQNLQGELTKLGTKMNPNQFLS